MFVFIECPLYATCILFGGWFLVFFSFIEDIINIRAIEITVLLKL